MASTEPEPSGVGRWLRWTGRQVCRVAALLVWAGICGYAWLRGALPAPYTVAAVGGVVGVALAAGQVFDRRWLPAARSGVDRWLLVGCLVGVAAGTVGVGRAVVAGDGRPDAVWGVVLVAALIGLAWRLVDGRLAGVAALAFAAAAAADPGPALVTAVVAGPVGVYGTPTRAITWLGPVCLLAGVWRAAGLGRQLRALWPVDDGASELPAESRRLLGVTALVGVLIAWRTATGRSAAGLVWGAALLPAALLPAAMGLRERLVVVRGRPAVSSDTDGESEVDGGWRLVIAAGPVALMRWLVAGPRPPVGTVLVAGCLLAVGLCLLAGVARTLAGERKDSVGSRPGRPPIGGRTVVDGAVEGVGLLARVVVALAVVGAAVAAAESVGLSTRLLSGVLWLGGGSVGGLVALGGLCVVAGAAMPTLAGYAAAALVAVPLVRTLAAVDPVAAHLGVWYAVAVGTLIAVLWRRSDRGGLAGGVIRARA
ncbi:hypothetical protein [Halohasta salina]|uniref:hypothetical protein n=1 Tax=Halohasta salina TaxID=2961621 RepID=UPI0020A4EECA|nr:hypothetical protein [Halohasta salina]